MQLCFILIKEIWIILVSWLFHLSGHLWLFAPLFSQMPDYVPVYSLENRWWSNIQISKLIQLSSSSNVLCSMGSKFHDRDNFQCSFICVCTGLSVHISHTFTNSTSSLVLYNLIGCWVESVLLHLFSYNYNHSISITRQVLIIWSAIRD